MAAEARRFLIAAFLLIALTLCILGATTWQSADNDAEGNPFASLADQPRPADHTASAVEFICAGLAVLCAVTLMASMPEPERENAPSPEGEGVVNDGF